MGEVRTIWDTQDRSEPDTDLDRLAHHVISAAIEVHRHLGPGLLESLYEDALCVEFAQQAIPFQRQAPIEMTYKGMPIGEGRLDLLVDQRLVVELKAVERLLPIHLSQVLSYLRAAHLNLGLILNFNTVVLRDGIQRVIRT